MPKSELLFNEPLWLILICLLVGAVYAYFLYSKKSPWPEAINYLLAILRFVLVSFIGVLILGPFIKLLKNSIEKPIYIVAVDNSESLKYAMDSTAINEVVEGIDRNINSRDEQINIVTYNGNLVANARDLVFDEKSSNLNDLLRNVQEDYEGKNLAGVTLISDGIYNMGVSPSYSTYRYPINTIGLGDTIPKKDINVKAIYYNKVAYQGNKFSILAEIAQTGFSGEDIDISLGSGNRILDRKSVRLSKDGQITEVEFILDAVTEGMQHYTLVVKPKDSEFTIVNNSRDAYIEIIKGKKKIVLVAPAPHPDIKAIHRALETNENYDFIQFIPGLGKGNISDDMVFDLVIYHQYPTRRHLNLSSLDRNIASTTSKLFIVGARTNLARFNELNQVIKIQQKNIQADAVTPILTSGFSKFNLTNDYQEILESFPPVNAPFGNYILQANAEVLLYQRFGTVATNKPLVALRQLDHNKSGIIAADGIWQWRLQEYAETKEHVVFDELISKVVQYLSSSEVKRHFRAYPVHQEFFDNQEVEIETEVYNALYEPIYNQKIDIVIQDEVGSKNKYSFINSVGNRRFKLNAPKKGVYEFTASTQLDQKTETASGAFSVKKLQLESIDLTADHNLLRNVSVKSGGQFYFADQINEAFASFDLRQAKSIIHTEQEFQPLINFKWLLYLLLIVISMEWFIRKYTGGY